MTTKDTLELENVIEKWLDGMTERGEYDGYVTPDIIPNMASAAGSIWDMMLESQKFAQEQEL